MSCNLYCRSCGYEVDEKNGQMSCPKCRKPLWVSYDRDKMKAALSPAMPGPSNSLLRQWKDVLPIEDESLIDAVSLGEPESPFLSSRGLGASMGLKNLHFKLEMGPTLSLKDRGTSLCVLKALELKSECVCVASSGNNAASVSAYAARAGIPAVVFIQKNVSPSKVLKSIAYGAKVIRVDGDMGAASALCAEMVTRRGWMNCGGPNPYRIAAKRTAGFEIVRQLGKAPDALIVPCGGGAGLVSMHEAFKELKDLGIIPCIPRLYGVQLAACNPTEQAFVNGRDSVTPVQTSPSLSDAIMNNNPFWGAYDLLAARETNGAIVSVSDARFVAMIRTLGCREGLFTEPAGCVAVAALQSLLESGRISREESVVCTLTGHGLNAPQVAVNQDEIPEAIPPAVEAVENLLHL